MYVPAVPHVYVAGADESHDRRRSLVDEVSSPHSCAMRVSAALRDRRTGYGTVLAIALASSTNNIGSMTGRGITQMGDDGRLEGGHA
jgi:crotonobetainyl-CoA:carnitine CoA-transferase CaiB-like acyl-CoA transferase